MNETTYKNIESFNENLKSISNSEIIKKLL